MKLRILGLMIAACTLAACGVESGGSGGQAAGAEKSVNVYN